MTDHNFDDLLAEVSNRQAQVHAYLSEDRNQMQFVHPHLQEAVYSYIKAGGKSLRPAIVMFACGAVGGEEAWSLPAAAAVELYHTFTLVHDDIIDRDPVRRGVPTVHTAFSKRASNELAFESVQADHYGLTIAILAGDLQQGLAAALMSDLHFTYQIPPELTLFLIRHLFQVTQLALINGEALDVMQAQTPIGDLEEIEVLDMLWQKTGALYAFAGQAGAAIGLKHHNFDHPLIQAVGAFTSKCGIAFQLKDDILGVRGNTGKIGKTVGADIREGKRTTIVLYSYKHMNLTERKFAESVLGNQRADDEEVEKLIDLLEARGGIEHARTLAQTYLDEALEMLYKLPETAYRNLMESWAKYITAREK
jgi:geranylgeranyl diphosphate synthase type I